MNTAKHLTRNILISVFLIATLSVAIFLFGSGTLGQTIGGCQLITPTWQYLKCEVKADAFATYTLQVPQGLGDYSESPAILACNQKDIKNKGSFSCKYTIANTNLDNPQIYINDQRLTKGGTVYLSYGTVATIRTSKYLSSTSYTLQKTYDQLVLRQYTFTGRYEERGIGCDITAQGIDTSKLPQGYATSLTEGQSINFIDTFISVPVTGNYIDSPTYGRIIVGSSKTPSGYPVYKLSELTADEPNENGKYVASGGACYYTAGTSIMTYFACLPGETSVDGLQVCSQDGRWIGADKGQCIKGGIASNSLCPGGGGTIVDLQSSQAYNYQCNANTGSCDKVNAVSAQCNPSGNAGCSGGQYCDPNTYTCKSTGTARQPCTYDWCKDNPSFIDKACSSGLQACQDAGSTFGSCKTSCEGVAPPKDACTAEGGNTRRTLIDSGTPCCSANSKGEPLIEDDKGYCKIEGGITGDWLMIGGVLLAVLILFVAVFMARKK